MAAEVKEFFIRDIKGDMSESDLGHGGGEGRCYYFMSFEDMGSHSDNSGDVCAVFKHELSCIIAASGEVDAKARVRVDLELIKEEFAKLRESEVLGFVIVIATNADFGELELDESGV